jgi:hypothetical protein
MNRLLATCTIVACLAIAAPQTRADFLDQSYPGASFKTEGGNTALGVHHSGDVFGDGTTARKYIDTLQPFDPKSLANITGFLLKTFNTKDDFGHNFGTTYSLAQAAFTDKNELTVKSYSTYASTGGRVGADMYVSYAKTGAKDPAAKTVQWLQVITDNWSIVPGKGQPGVKETLVDVTKMSASPFYNDSYDANQKGLTYLFDAPGRSSKDLATYKGGFPLTWSAQTFAVVDTLTNDRNGKDILDVYGGFSWGWQVNPTPEPSTFVIGLVGSALLLGTRVRGRSAKRA